MYVKKKKFFFSSRRPTGARRTRVWLTAARWAVVSDRSRARRYDSRSLYARRRGRETIIVLPISFFFFSFFVVGQRWGHCPPTFQTNFVPACFSFMSLTDAYTFRKAICNHFFLLFFVFYTNSADYVLPCKKCFADKTKTDASTRKKLITIRVVPQETVQVGRQVSRNESSFVSTRSVAVRFTTQTIKTNGGCLYSASHSPQSSYSSKGGPRVKNKRKQLNGRVRIPKRFLRSSTNICAHYCTRQAVGSVWPRKTGVRPREILIDRDNILYVTTAVRVGIWIKTKRVFVTKIDVKHTRGQCRVAFRVRYHHKTHVYMYTVLTTFCKNLWMSTVGSRTFSRKYRPVRWYSFTGQNGL